MPRPHELRETVIIVLRTSIWQVTELLEVALFKTYKPVFLGGVTSRAAISFYPQTKLDENFNDLDD